MNVYRKYFAPELKKVWDKDVKQPAVRLQRIVTRQNFGDEQSSLLKTFSWTMVRIAIVLPVGAVGVVLCMSVIGLPLGLPIMAWVGAFVSKPIRKHPAFTVDTTPKADEEDWTY